MRMQWKFHSSYGIKHKFTEHFKVKDLILSFISTPKDYQNELWITEIVRYLGMNGLTQPQTGVCDLGRTGEHDIYLGEFRWKVLILWLHGISL